MGHALLGQAVLLLGYHCRLYSSESTLIHRRLNELKRVGPCATALILKAGGVPQE